MMHVLETRVDILVRGAWLCTSIARDAEHHIHIRFSARHIGLHPLPEVRVCRLCNSGADSRCTGHGLDHAAAREA
jgi:hypothetical protein